MLQLRHTSRLLCASCGLTFRNSSIGKKFVQPPSPVPYRWIPTTTTTEMAARHFAVRKIENDETKERQSISLYGKVKPFLDLMRFDRPVGTMLLFWPCGWSIALSAPAGHLPDLYKLGLFAAGAFIMRGAGCTINDMWDRDIDAKVERTKMRPLVSGQIAMVDAWSFLALQLSAGCAILMQLNANSLILGASSLGLVIVYPLMKRFTHWPQFVLGLTFNWGALLGWCATQGNIWLPACLPLYASGVCWTIIYDTIYAHQDKVDDALLGVKSTALRFGSNTKLWLTGFTTAMMGNLALVGSVCDLEWPFYVSLATIGCHIGHQIYSLDVNNPRDCAKKFFSNHQVGLILFLGIVFGVLLQQNEEKPVKSKVQGTTTSLSVVTLNNDKLP